MTALGKVATQQPRGRVGEGLAATYRATAQGARGVSGLAQMAGLADPQSQALVEALPQALPPSQLPPDASLTKKGAYYLTNLAGESAPGLAPLALGAIPGVGPGLAVGAMTAQSGAETTGNTYLDAMQRGADPTTATTEALFTGAGSALLNSLPAAQMASKVVTGNPAVKAALAKVISSEAGQKALNVAIGSQVNGVTGAADTTMRAIMRAAFENDPEAFATLPQDALQAWLGGSIVGGAIEGREFLPGPKAPDFNGGVQFARDAQDAYRRGMATEPASRTATGEVVSPSPLRGDYARTPNVEGIRPNDVTTLDNPQAVRQSTTDLRDPLAEPAPNRQPVERAQPAPQVPEPVAQAKEQPTRDAFVSKVQAPEGKPELQAKSYRFAYQTDDGEIISPSARAPGKVQVTRFNERGKPSGHEEYRSLAEAVSVHVPREARDVLAFPRNDRLDDHMEAHAILDRSGDVEKSDRAYAYSSGYRPFGFAPHLRKYGKTIDVAGGTRGVLFSKEPLPLGVMRDNELLPLTSKTRGATAELWAKEQLPQPENTRGEAPAANVEGVRNEALAESVGRGAGVGAGERAPESTAARDAGGAAGDSRTGPMTREQAMAELDARGVKYGPKVKTENLVKKVEALRAKEASSEPAPAAESPAPGNVDRVGGVRMGEPPVERAGGIPEQAAVDRNASVPVPPERAAQDQARGEGPQAGSGGGGGVKPKTMRAPEIAKTAIHRAINEEVPDYVTKPGRSGQQLRDTSTAETLKGIATNSNTGYFGAGEVSDYTRLMSLVGWMDKAGNLRDTSMVGVESKKLRPGDQWDIDKRFTMTVTKAGPDGVTIHAHDRQSYNRETAYEYTVPTDKTIPANKGSIRRGQPIDSLVPAKTMEQARAEDDALRSQSRYNRNRAEPAPGEPGVQGGLLGERFKGGITGEQGRMFETRKGESALTADEAAKAEARTAESSRDKETGTMFEDAPFQESRDLNQNATPTQPAGRIPVAPIADAPFKTIKQITLDMTKELGPVYTKNPGKRNAAGVYRPGTAETVVRYAGDLDTTAHEVGHKLDDAYGLVADYAQSKAKSPFDAELIPHFSKYGSKGPSLQYKRAEGVAEWLRAYMVNPDAAKAAAPQFYDHFTKTVPADVRARLESFGNDIRGFMGRSATEKTIANIETDPNKRTISEKLADLWGNRSAIVDRLKAETTDSFAPLWTGIETAKALRGIDDLLPSKNPQRLIRTFAGVDGKIESIYERGMIDAQNRTIPGRGGVDWLLEPLKGKDRAETDKNIEQAMAFGLSERVIEKAVQFTKETEDKIAKWTDKAKAAGLDGTKIAKGAERLRRANELRIQRLSGAGAGIMSDLDVAKSVLSEVSRDPAKLEKIQEATKRYRTWADSVLQYARDKGRISADQYQKITDANQDYFAMNRIMDTLAGEALPPSGKRLSSAKDVSKRFKGGTEEIGNPYVNLLMQTSRVVREADRNAAMRSIRDLLTNERGMYQGKPVDLSSIGRIAKEGDPDTVTIYVDGKAEKWQFAPDIHRALKNWNEIDQPGLLELGLRAPGAFTRAMVTSAPGFIVRNKIRDAAARAVISESGAKPWGEAYFFTKEGRAGYDQMLDDLRRSGGANFGYFAADRADYHKGLAEAIKKVQGDERSVLTLPKNIADAYGKFGKRMEETGRLDEYRRSYDKAIKSGMSEYDAQIEAAYQARDILDFARGGVLIKRLNRYVPFVNANIQGLEKTYRAARANPAGVLGRWMAYVGSFELGTLIWNMTHDDEEEYRQLPAYQKDFFWNYKLGNDTWLRIPKPFEMGVTASMVSRAIESARGDEHPYEGALGSMAKAILPVDEATLVGPSRTAVELMTNYDFFRGRSIVPPHEKDLRADLRKGTENASRAGKLFQSVFGIDARQGDHIIRSLTGGWATPLMAASDIGRNDKPGSATKAAQGVAGVFTDSPASAARDVQWVQEYARTNGQLQKPYYTGLKQLLDAYHKADTEAKRDAAAKAVRDYATATRRSLEANPKP